MQKEYPFTEYPIVQEAGPDAMRIRIAVTSLNPGRPAVCGTVMAVVPLDLTLGTIKTAITGEDIGAGSASMEVEILDSMTNERIAAAIDYYHGSKDSCIEKNGVAREAFAFWSKRFRAFMDAIHGE